MERYGKTAWYGNVMYPSQLKARWAHVLDCLGIEYTFRPTKFELIDESATLYYSPDFWLPELGIWLDVNGMPHTEADDHKYHLFAELENEHLLVVGVIPRTHPHFHRHNVLEWAREHSDTYKGILYQPRQEPSSPHLICECQHCKRLSFNPNGIQPNECCCEETHDPDFQAHSTTRILWAYTHGLNYEFR